MRMGKKAVYLTTGLFVAIAASACGDAAEDAAQNPSSDPGTVPAVTEAPPADPGAVPAPPAAAPGAEPTAPAGAAGAGNNAALVAQGQTAYASSVCVSCHGPQGQGTPLAPAFTDDEWLVVTPGPNLAADVANVIKTGVPTPRDPAHVAPMPPYGGIPLSDDQVNALAAYVVSLSQ